jgi:hypothetical protein
MQAILDGTSASPNASGTLGTLTLTNSLTQRSLRFQGDYVASDFHIATGLNSYIMHTPGHVGRTEVLERLARSARTSRAPRRKTEPHL